MDIGKKMTMSKSKRVRDELITSPGVEKVNAFRFIKQHIKPIAKLSLISLIVVFQ